MTRPRILFSNIMAQVEKKFGESLLGNMKPFGACVLSEEVKLDSQSLAIVSDESLTVTDRMKVRFHFFEPLDSTQIRFRMKN